VQGEATLPLAVLAAAERLWNFHVMPSALRRTDVIVVLGSYDLRVADHAAGLFRDGLSELVVTTGGYGNWTRGKFQRPEGEIFADALVSSGVPRERVIVEPKAANIRENIEFTRAVLAERTVGSAIFVTKPQTQRRVFATVKAAWPEVDATVCAPNLTFPEQPTEGHNARDLINEMVGDLVRLKLYAERGWQIRQEIPPDVDEATRFLIEAGFTSHLPKPDQGAATI
jgi:uncharacterized SAM-binding protein YcdF (DUF218 family)